MSKRTKYIIPIFAIVVSMSIGIAITGCGPLKKGTKKDIEFFIRNDMGLEQFDIIGGPVKVKFGSTDDWMWTAETDAYSLPEPVIFHVYNILEYTGEHSVRVTYSDLDYVLDGIMFNAYTGWTDDLYFEDIEIPSFAKGHSIMRITRNIRERKDLDSFARELKDLISYMNSEYPEVMGKKILGREHIVNCACSFVQTRHSDMWLPSPDTEYIHCDKAEEDIRNMLDSSGYYRNGYHFDSPVSLYLRNCLEHGLLDRINEFSVEEREKIIALNNYSLEEIYIEDFSGNVRPTGYACRYNRVPYGTLYMLLGELGIEAAGTWEKFSFAGTDGEVHAFDYEEFTDKVLDPEVQIEDFEKMTGIKIDRTEKDGRYIRVAKSSD